jgi:phage antirepressor YoqD-like protein
MSNQTMTSKEMAELTEKRHDSVKRTIVTLAQKTAISYPQFVDGIPGANGVAERVYYVSKRDSYVVVAQLSPEFTARLVDRWQELEAAAQAPAMALPQTFAQALRLAAEQAEVIESQAAALEAAQPAIQMVERYVEAKSSKCLSDVAKILGWKPRAFIAELAAHGVIFQRAGSWVPYQNYIDSGKFTVKTGESNGHAYHQTRVEPAGIEWLARTYGKEQA